jgi:hypothetical protein
LSQRTKQLQTIPNIGPAMAQDLLRLGVTRPEDLVGRDAVEMYEDLCRLDGRRHDPCVEDTFASAVFFANTGERRPWWSFTPERKARVRAAGSRQ